MIESLKYWDTQLFLWLNDKHNAFFDIVLFWASNKLFWIPLYLFLIYLLFKNYNKRSYWILLAVAILILCADQFSVGLKNYFQRLRPCHEHALEGLVHMVKSRCGGSFGFVSSHATNHFAIAVFLSFIFKNTYKYFTPIILLWAAVITYSRVYLGVHYPGDILGGAILGITLGFLIGKIYLTAEKKYLVKTQ